MIKATQVVKFLWRMIVFTGEHHSQLQERRKQRRFRLDMHVMY